jgi:putative ABC transport system permease protein
MLGRDAANALGVGVGSQVTIGYRAADNGANGANGAGGASGGGSSNGSSGASGGSGSDGSAGGNGSGNDSGNGAADSASGQSSPQPSSSGSSSSSAQSTSSPDSQSSDPESSSQQSQSSQQGSGSSSSTGDMSGMNGMSGMSGMDHGAHNHGGSTGSGSSDSGATSGSSSSSNSSGTSTSGNGSINNGTDGRVSTDILNIKGTQFRVSGIVSTGGSEDEIVYAEASDLAALTGITRGADVIEYSSDASGNALAGLVASINRDTALGAKAQQVTKITSSNQRIITMLQTLFWIVSLVVLVLTLVGVGTTISSIVSQRRNEIGLRKALGAPSRGVGLEFHAESALYGLLGGLVGTGIGYGFARVLGLTVFHRVIGFDWALGVASVALSVLVAVAASIPPVRRATRIDPAVVLREE